mmetsp:Transcript_29573/g.96304  ORF Transcript_29573/g.96304 Transcript_29573/m.96304 type:complete len:201 (+) Transcript_29573:1284-1886(+)
METKRRAEERHRCERHQLRSKDTEHARDDDESKLAQHNNRLPVEVFGLVRVVQKAVNRLKVRGAVLGSAEVEKERREHRNADADNDQGGQPDREHQRQVIAFVASHSHFELPKVPLRLASSVVVLFLYVWIVQVRAGEDRKHLSGEFWPDKKDQDDERQRRVISHALPERLRLHFCLEEGVFDRRVGHDEEQDDDETAKR